MKEEIKEITGFDSNDFLIRLSPSIDENNEWDGSLGVSIVTSKDNDLGDEDFEHMIYLANIVASSIPYMETDEDFRTQLVDYTDELLDKYEEEEQDDVSELNHEGNVVKVDFRNKHQGDKING